MFSLLGRALTRVSLVARTVPCSVNVSQRLSFSVYPRVSFPAAAAAAKSASEKTKSQAKPTAAAKKTTTKSAAAAKKTTGKKVTAAKKVVKKKKPAKKPEEVKFKLTKEMMPPKKPGSPFVFYVAKVRADSPKAETTKEGAEIMVKAGEQWRALSDAEKAPYCAEHEAALAKYTLARDEWWRNADKSLVRVINEKRMAKKKPKMTSKRAPGDKYPGSPYSFFISHQIRTSTLTSGGSKSVFREGGELWKSLPDKEKAHWQDLARKAREVWAAKHVEVAKQVGTAE
ncbi:hypothetical protein BDV98DRAFT_607385 [Pterulicium gracile]|uniref:HMG box domain-containing protein n=1 Tax=Pterulicium gracile TaxID=1884261 RepID=A0A5C3Q9E9_9AGAR|nr:hypothetical protein BDV98DRAFT_607385 [Pterula gracilis]